MNLSVQIANFRSIRKTTLQLRPGINILIGPNGSGKTNLLAALKFLREIHRQGVALAMGKSGGPIRNYYRGQSTISFTVKSDYGTRVYQRKKVHYSAVWSVSIAQIGPEQIAAIRRETLDITANVDGQDVSVFRIFVDRRTTPSRPRSVVFLAEATDIGRDFLTFFQNQSKSDSKRVVRDRALNIFEQVIDRVKKDSDRTFLPEIGRFDVNLSSMVEGFTGLNEYNILPDIARQATDQLPYAEIGPHGAGLGEVIHALRTRSYHRLMSPEEYEELTPRYYVYRASGGRGYPVYVNPLQRASIRYRNRRARTAVFEGALERINEELSMAVRAIDGVSTRIDASNGRRFVVFKSGEHEFRPEEVSDGTIKWLTILTSIFVPMSTTYVLEEPENFLHPWMQQQLIRIMRKQADASGTVFLITTHSATVLNAATPQETTVVGMGEGGTETYRLSNRTDIGRLLEETDFGLGDLWVSGAIGGVPGGEF